MNIQQRRVRECLCTELSYKRAGAVSIETCCRRIDGAYSTLGDIWLIMTSFSSYLISLWSFTMFYLKATVKIKLAKIKHSTNQFLGRCWSVVPCLMSTIRIHCNSYVLFENVGEANMLHGAFVLVSFVGNTRIGRMCFYYSIVSDCFLCKLSLCP